MSTIRRIWDRETTPLFVSMSSMVPTVLYIAVQHGWI